MNDRFIAYYISSTKKKMTNFIEAKIKEKEIYDIVPAYGNVLTALYNNNGELTMKDIGKLVGKDKSTITALVNKLAKQGYVSKEKCQIDKRVTYVKTTEKGKSIKDKFFEVSGEVYECAYKGFTEDEKYEFLRLLKKLNNNFDLD